ncbi:hypothetical protein DFH07DRAFT_966923 [Mycena maculata]|uniref:Uncharacterized protein n=1 Tax=Mycena maculata TaxID=230809 RepID=A0AAD7MX76_9AGAR|nr:hypothetical protein DFH07DRAFT_966923 [Mycena maculata]
MQSSFYTVCAVVAICFVSATQLSPNAANLQNRAHSPSFTFAAMNHNILRSAVESSTRDL